MRNNIEYGIGEHHGDTTRATCVHMSVGIEFHPIATSAPSWYRAVRAELTALYDQIAYIKLQIWAAYPLFDVIPHITLF